MKRAATATAIMSLVWIAPAHSDERGWTEARGACEIAVNYLAEKGNLPLLSFSSFLPRDESDGKVTLVELDIHFSTWLHASIACTYDLQDKKVINLQVIEVR
jgi:hypothetical protein